MGPFKGKFALCFAMDRQHMDKKNPPTMFHTDLSSKHTLHVIRSLSTVGVWRIVQTAGQTHRLFYHQPTCYFPRNSVADI